MRKCPRCQIVYASKNRLKCLYCDSALIPAELDEILVRKEQSRQRRMDFNRTIVSGPIGLSQMQYLLGVFFKVRSFAFSYEFCRNQLKIGKEYERYLIEPLGFSSIIKLPWVFVNVVDSFLFHSNYKGYCPRCHCKHKHSIGPGSHPKEECDYNQEYNALLKDIISGDIVKTEEKFTQLASRRVKAGLRSSYHELCTRKRVFEQFLDIIIILLSMSFLIYILAKLGFIFFGKFYDLT